MPIPGRLVEYSDFPSTFVSPRPLAVWLPPGYSDSGAQRYPVIYLQDGEKVFRASQGNSGNWGAAETITRLARQDRIRPAILVAIWSTANRAGEYMPVKPLQLFPRKAEQFYAEHRNRVYIPRSDEYLNFIVHELKPFIDARYRTLLGQADTWIMGSSRGALISLYAVAEYPEIFAGAACLSTHWPHGDGLLIDWLETHLPSPGQHKFYFDYGTQGLDAAYAPYQARLDALLATKSYRPGLDWITRFFDGAGHDEAAWRARLHLPLEFFLAADPDSPE